MTFLEIFAGGLAVVAGKQFYGDALRPGAKEIGKAGAAAVRAIRAAGYGPEQVVALRDDLIAFVGQAVRRVPEASRIEPAPQILGPILEQLRYEPIDTPVAEMLEAILARGMDKDRVFDAHPAFIQTIRSLSADEVRLLRHIYRTPLVTPWVVEPVGSEVTVPFDIPAGLLEAPSALPLYLSHLSSQDLCIQSEETRGAFAAIANEGNGVVQVEHRMELRLLAFGEHLMRAADLSSSPGPSAGDTGGKPPAS